MIKVFYSSIAPLRSADPDELYRSLPKWRQEAADAVKNTDEKYRSIGAGLLLVRSLAAIGIDAYTASVARNPHGKPCLPDIPDVHFSLSHSGELVMCAVSDAEIGCDIQQIKSARISVSQRFFTLSEQQCIVEATDPRDEFVRIWVRKESYVKMMGLGISACPLTSFDVSDGTTPENAFFYEQRLPEYRAAVCCKQQSDILWERIELI